MYLDNCDLCETKFNYKSKYMRHLESTAHKRRALMISCELEDDISDEVLLQIC